MEETKPEDCCGEENCEHPEQATDPAPQREVCESTDSACEIKTIASPEACIVESKQLRVEIDAVIQKLKHCATGRTSRPRSICLTNLQQAVMWLGMDLKELGNENPYPHSYDPSNAKVSPTADGLKM